MSITTTSFSPNTLISSASVNTNFSNITTAVPWSSNPIAAKGDLVVGTAASTATAVTVGSDGKVLTADSSQTNGVAWSTPASSPTESKELRNLGIAATVGSNALTLTLTQSDGSTTPSTGANAVKIGFRNSTTATGGYNERSVTSALTMVVSNGSTLGTTSAAACYFYVYGIDNAGTVELAVSSFLYDEGSVVTTTAEGGAGAADSGLLIYSSVARSSVGVRLLARILSTQSTAGVWAAAVTQISLAPFVRRYYPTIQKFTSSTGTYTTPAGVSYLRVRMVGGGGGGAGGGTGSVTGTTGGATTFGTALLSAGGGIGAVSNTQVGGAGGASSLGTGPIGTALTGGAGGGGSFSDFSLCGGMGGTSFFSSGPSGGGNNSAPAALANTGAGGGGGGSGGANQYAGSGGGSGGFIDAIITNVLATYAYAIGAGGAGAAGSATTGGTGGSGYIEVTEYYQ